MTDHLDSKADAPITPTETAAALTRIEEKLDLILARLEWAPQSMVSWYAEITGAPHPNPDPTDDRPGITNQTLSRAPRGN